MCIAAAAIPAASLAISAVSTVASIGMGIMSAQMQAAQAQAQLNMQAQQQQQNMEMQRQSMLMQQQQNYNNQLLQQRQAQQQYNLSIEQSNTQIANQFNQQRAQVEMERINIQRKYAADRIAYQRGVEEQDKQIKYNNEAANKVYEQEQAKVSEARKKAAFAQQTALAKSIGSKGAILSAGRTGQSVGLLINDAERVSGFAEAQANAELESKVEMAAIGMDQAYISAQSANNRAESAKGMAPIAPYMPSFPGIPNFVTPKVDNTPAYA